MINFPTVLTPGQRAIFDKVKAFVLEYRKSISPHKLGEARLAKEICCWGWRGGIEENFEYLEVWKVLGNDGKNIECGRGPLGR